MEGNVMCEFASYVDTRHRIYFLTGDQVYRSERGQALRDYCQSADDLPGHGAIRWFYGLDSTVGTNRECTDFSSPSNFPAEIAAAIKRGEMRGMGTPEGLLSQDALDEYRRVIEAAWAEYRRVIEDALDEYRRVTQPALDEYNKRRRSHAPRWLAPLGFGARRVREPALAEYRRVIEAALAEYERVPQPAFWDLFAIPENRAEAWR